MKRRILSLIAIAGIVGAFVAFAHRSLADTHATQADAATQPAAPPATAPATVPTGFSFRGTVKIAANMDFAGANLTKVIIYLDSNPLLDDATPPKERAVVAQRNKAFVPNFLVIPINTEVEFPNWDHFAHNVFSRSAAAPAFDLDRYPYGQSKTRQFEKVGVVQVFCNIHPYMKALIFVTPNRYFTRPDRDGNFEIIGLPAGAYKTTAWQERCAPQHQSVEVGPGLSPVLDFVLKEDRNSILANDPPRHEEKYGIDRGLGVKREKLNLPVVQDVHPAPTSAPCADCQ